MNTETHKSFGTLQPNFRIKPGMYVRCSIIYKKLRFFSQNWLKENYRPPEKSA